jgi:hypothetical protein
VITKESPGLTLTDPVPVASVLPTTTPSQGVWGRGEAEGVTAGDAVGECVWVGVAAALAVIDGVAAGVGSGLGNTTSIDVSKASEATELQEELPAGTEKV